MFDKVPGLAIHAYAPDIMHCLHVGAYSYFIGSIMKHLSQHHMTGTVKHNCDQIWEVLEKAYKDRWLCILK